MYLEIEFNVCFEVATMSPVQNRDAKVIGFVPFQNGSSLQCKMKVCCVEGCRGPDTPNPVFFEFPSSRLLRKRWLDAVRRTADCAGVVCVRHFARGDYDMVRGEARLRSRVVPSRRMGQSDSESSDTESTSDSESDVPTDRASDLTNKHSRTHNDKDDANKNGVDQTEDVIKNDDKTNRNSNTENGRLNNDRKSVENGKNDEETDINDGRRISNDNAAITNEINKTEDIIETNKEVSQDENISDGSDKIKDASDKTKDTSEKLKDISDKTNDPTSKVKDTSDKTKESDKYKDTSEKTIESDKVKDVSDIIKGGRNKINAISDKLRGIKEKSVKINQIKKSRCKITALRTVNGRKVSYSSDSSNEDDSCSPRRVEPDNKEDIEDALEHYYIENKKTERQVAAMTDVINAEQGKRTEESKKDQTEEPESSKPVFIELSVGQASEPASQGQPTDSDCLMLLESVQCEVDPTLLLAVREEEEANMEQVDLDDDDDDDEPVIVEKKKEDPISLLTSSDDDDVIIQEPKYDTVEVSSADESEDDMPLVKLVKPVAKKLKLTNKLKKNIITKLLWGKSDYYCVQCGFSTTVSSEYTSHMATHSQNQKIIQYCQDCGFTTCSKHQMQKHKQKHKNEKRFKCQKCNYSAKHKMSLVYHMKTHKNSLNEVELAICGTFEPSEKSVASDKKVSDVKKYKCGDCEYSTNRRSDLKRHRRRLHAANDDDDDDFIP